MMIMVNKIKSEVKYAMDDGLNNIIQTVNNKNEVSTAARREEIRFQCNELNSKDSYLINH